MKMFKKVLKIVGIVIAIPVVLALVFFGWLTFNEYRPKDVEKVSIDTSQGEGKKFVQGEDVSVVTWNMGYGALGDNADFFMDGGTSVMTATPERLDVNLAGFMGMLSTLDPDILFIQEIDKDSKRSYHVDEVEKIKTDYPVLMKVPNSEDKNFNGYVNTFAYNFKSKIVPFPPKEPIGKVESGIATMSKYQITDAERHSLPCPFKWPVKTVNLKRCLLVNRIPVYDKDGNDTGKELVLVNLHLEAYDDGSGKVEQTKVLKKIIQSEVDKGNYVIAGGDFNQTFDNTEAFSRYPIQEGKWKPGILDAFDIGNDFQCLMDNTTPTCRSLDQSYQNADKDNFQYYLIDGFIVSNNIKVNKLETVNTYFAPSDHNPVLLNFTIE